VEKVTCSPLVGQASLLVCDVQFHLLILWTYLRNVWLANHFLNISMLRYTDWSFSLNFRGIQVYDITQLEDNRFCIFIYLNGSQKTVATEMLAAYQQNVLHVSGRV